MKVLCVSWRDNVRSGPGLIDAPLITLSIFVHTATRRGALIFSQAHQTPRRRQWRRSNQESAVALSADRQSAMRPVRRTAGQRTARRLINIR